MQQDFHYYTVLALALAAGFRKDAAATVAYASQFVDDAKINQLSFKEAPAGIDLDSHDPPALVNMATCHSYSRLKTFTLAAMINNTCAFHMVPGCEGDGFAWRMVCRPDGAVIRKIVDKALETDDLVKLGMVLHPLADSYSHEGFSGLLSKPNDIQDLETKRHPFQLNQLLPWLIVKGWQRRKGPERFDTILDRLVPAYGHAQALNYPDISHLRWTYAYDEADISCKAPFGRRLAVDNTRRFGAALDRIAGCLGAFLERFPGHGDPAGQPGGGALYRRWKEEILFAESSQKKRIRRWRSELQKLGLDPRADAAVMTYDPVHWLTGAMDPSPPFTNYERKAFSGREVSRAAAGRDFGGSHWYRFYRAVMWYKKEFHRLCKAQGLEFPHAPYA